VGSVLRDKRDDSGYAGGGRMTRWIACADTMPTSDALYLIHAPSLDETSPLITVAWYEPGVGWSGLARMWLDAITHWMPLPEPPADGV